MLEHFLRYSSVNTEWDALNPHNPPLRDEGGECGLYYLYQWFLRAVSEALRMGLVRRFTGAVSAVAGFSLCLFASTSKDSFILDEAPVDMPVAVEIATESCGDITCMNIYPEDGKIEGKEVLQMTPSGMNKHGQVVGRCSLENSSDAFAFFREPDGRVWIFRTPSSSGHGEFTDVNESGDAVGFYKNDAMQSVIGFLMNSSRQWVADIKYPDNSCPPEKSHLHTQPNGINSDGEIVGNIACTVRPEDVAETLFYGDGFYRDADGTFYRVQYENAARTVAGKISDNGIIVGYYVLDNDVWIPFAAMKEDVIRPINQDKSSVP